MKHQLKLCVADNRSFAPGWHLLRLESPEALPEMAPGQFVEVRVEAPGVLLNRPISIFDRTDRTLDLLVSPVGNATEALCALAEGSDLTVIAPLGHGFTTTFEPGTRVLLIGGGVGIAPLYYQLRMLRDAGVDVEVVFGSRTASDAALCALFERLAPLHICTDDGTAGLHGLVTDHPELERGYGFIQVCGPKPMMKAVAAVAAAKGIPCEVSLENMMACGFGVCLCCTETTANGNIGVCKNGPVFNTSTLAWNQISQQQ